MRRWARLTGSDGKASIIYIKSDDPANDGAIRKEIESTPGLQGYRVQSMEDILSMYTPARFPGFDIALNVVITIAVIVGFLVIFQSMYTAVLERTREIGILKSMGASKADHCWRRAARVRGAGRSPEFWWALRPPSACARCWAVRFPGFAFELTGAWIVNGALIAFAGALCGALYPAWMAARKDPIDALAYE